MDVRNCRRCGKIFNYVAGPHICPACRELIENQFVTVKDYIREHKDANMAQICEACEVPESQIKQWIREERLFFGDDSPVGIECEGCGATIKIGKYCDKCKANLTKGLLDATAKPKAAEPDITHTRKGSAGGKMRFLE
ncbi:MAG: flagellar protein [Lachnospiraceae bacterium]|nr:flagellar protein [Lachnospiraceae bacterium]MBP5275390.1 flagellar protein [Lachnospiraceae bacterium]MBP5564740.1 flagellar protein [Lachnospiraceae bacterium]